MEDDIFAAVAVRASSETEQPGQLPSSSDLAIPHPVLLPLVSVYKVLVQHFNLAHLIFEEFCAAVAHHDQSSIVSDVFNSKVLVTEIHDQSKLSVVGREFSPF